MDDERNDEQKRSTREQAQDLRNEVNRAKRTVNAAKKGVQAGRAGGRAAMEAGRAAGQALGRTAGQAGAQGLASGGSAAAGTTGAGSAAAGGTAAGAGGTAAGGAAATAGTAAASAAAGAASAAAAEGVAAGGTAAVSTSPAWGTVLIIVIIVILALMVIASFFILLLDSPKDENLNPECAGTCQTGTCSSPQVEDKSATCKSIFAGKTSIPQVCCINPISCEAIGGTCKPIGSSCAPGTPDATAVCSTDTNPICCVPPGPSCDQNDPASSLKEGFNVIVTGYGSTNKQYLYAMCQMLSVPGKYPTWLSYLKYGGHALELNVTTCVGSCISTGGPNLITLNGFWNSGTFNSRTALLIHETGHTISSRYPPIFQAFPWTNLVSSDRSCYDGGFLKSYPLRYTCNGVSYNGITAKSESFAESLMQSLMYSKYQPPPSGYYCAVPLPNFPTQCNNTFDWVMGNVFK